jgi:hypothetical protein
MIASNDKFAGGEVVTFEKCTLHRDPFAPEPDSMMIAGDWTAMAGHIEIEPRYGRVAWILEMSTDRVIQAIANNRNAPAPGLIRNLRIVSRLGVEG